MYRQLAAANKTPLLNIVSGYISWERGERLLAKMGMNKATGAKGKEKAMHIRAFESAPPNAPL